MSLTKPLAGLLLALLLAGCEQPPAPIALPAPPPPLPATPSTGKGIRTNELKFTVLQTKDWPSAAMALPQNNPVAGYLFVQAADGVTYLWVTLGQRPTTGYGVAVQRVEDIEGVTQVTVSEATPPKGTMQGMVVTHPATVIRYSGGTPRLRVVTDKGSVLPALATP